MMNKNSWKLGDVVEYRGEAWYVGFENVLTFKGTYRLQKGHSAYDRQVNRVSVDEMKPVNKKRLEELSGKGDTTAKEVLKHLESCDEPLSDEELQLTWQCNLKMQSEKYKKNLKELDIGVIIVMSIEASVANVNLDSWEFMSGALQEYKRRTGRIPGYIGAVATLIKKVISIIKESTCAEIAMVEILRLHHEI